MSNETEHPKTVLDLLESEVENYSNIVKHTWEYSGERTTDIKMRFIAYHLASIKTFMKVVMNPTSAFTFVLGAVARDLINCMTEDEKAELATITLEQLDYSHERHEDGNEED